MSQQTLGATNILQHPAHQLRLQMDRSVVAWQVLVGE